jgi:hypothetical protein
MHLSRTLRSSMLATLVLMGAPSAWAQGSDDCSAAMAIAGFGSFALDTSAATTSTNGSDCVGMQQDHFWQWTAPSSGLVTVTTCSLVGFDSVLAVYSGAGCPSGPASWCVDDSCGYQTTLVFPAQAGSVYVLRIGSYPGSLGGTGSFSISAGGPPGCTSTNGPDVIVGDIGDIANYTPLLGSDAISLGTTSCNIGDTWLDWFASTNRHPVIGGNLYRYMLVDGASRFEHIGMSWLKHGFYALSDTLCCPACVATDGTHLGVSCSDPYTAERNGSQSGLGPRWQVNATTGVFTYPPANPPWSGPVARRLQFTLQDIDTSATTRYVGETQYVTPDDAAAGNHNNNASWRELAAGGTSTNRVFTLLGTTQRQQSALSAWAQFDAGVTLSQAQADGLYLVGSRATQLANGLWRYEYAVQNLNSDRAAGVYTVPVPAGVSISNVGFHDVHYSNGDGPSSVNYSGQDWTPTVTAGAVSWACLTQAQSASANALRWGSTYNFRFDAPVGPTQGSASIGLWKSGGAASVAATIQLPSAGNTGAAYCLGDGSGTACPCGNLAPVGAQSGCLNSLGQGARLLANGLPSLSADTLQLTGSNMPDSTALYFQGTAQQSGGVGVVFGDGLRCAAGTVVRLGTKLNVAGSSSYPTGSEVAVSVRGLVSAPGSRAYQVWYRNAAAFCSASTFNLTNGWWLVWSP